MQELLLSDSCKCQLAGLCKIWKWMADLAKSAEDAHTREPQIKMTKADALHSVRAKTSVHTFPETLPQLLGQRQRG